jgi:zinc D-Ala-D-Ala carboxypeptidase
MEDSSMPKMLSKNFSLDELIFSQTASRKRIDNAPDAATLTNLKRLAETLEIVRSALGDTPIIISSGYRSPVLNKEVGGSSKSAHMIGLAVDFTAPRYGTVLATAKAVAKSGIIFDQVIFEYGKWVHLGLAKSTGQSRGELLSIGDSQIYVTGLRTT